MKDPNSPWDDAEGQARIEDLDGEDLDIEELLDIEGQIEEKIEGYEAKAQGISGELLGEKLSLHQKKLLSEEKEALAEALESLLAQRENVRSQLRSRGYGREGDPGD